MNTAPNSRPGSKIESGIFAALMAAFVCLPASSAALGFSFAAAGQAFTGSAESSGMADASGAGPLVPAVPAASDDQTSKLSADGTRAIDQGRWADAVKIFSEVAAQRGDRADAALYWKAYAENKLGQWNLLQDSCTALRAGYPKSRWIEDCGALEVETRAKSGKPVEIDPNASDDVKLLALNAMLRQDEPRALAEIQAILNGDSSEKLKKEAEFILGHHYSDVTYAQIVRISYVEGDVRIQRGEPNGKASLGEWEKAVADLPIETGFSLVTGEGRAEIEFENASTIYLGENSVLTFNDLHETAGVPFTELALLSGTVSLNFRPYTPWEKMILHTPANDLVARFPSKSYARVEAYTDAVAVTPLPGGDIHLPGVPKDAYAPGRTYTYLQGQLLDAEGTAGNESFAAWDKWVADRVTQRKAATNSVMEAAGLSEPVPGLADMAGQGKFFECAPYGTCWEPNDIADQDDSSEQGSVQRSNQRPNQRAGFQLAAYHPSSRQMMASAAPMQAAQSAPAPRRSVDYFDEFPCMPASLRYRAVKDPVTGKQTVINSASMPDGRPYDWAVCHAGSWIRHKRHYVWVAGGKRHHIDPVRWIKSGRQVAFAPLHPYDVKGQPAINARHEVFAVSGKSEITVQPIRFEPNLPIEYMKEAPKDFRIAPMRPLAVAEVPRMETRPFANASGSRPATIAKAGVPIHFDAKSQTFMMARQEMRGGKTTTAFAPMTNHTGTLQGRASSFSGGSGFHGGSSVGSGSGGSRGGGGSSSGGGGSHGGGGSSSGSVATSSASSSSSSAASSSGGSHH